MPALAILLVIGIFISGCTDNSAQTELFGGLSDSSSDQAKVTPGYQIQFPDDHSSHPEYPVEWWYLTANLFDAEGNQYPIQWTLFRFMSNSPENPWADNQQYMAHAKLHTKNQGWFEERFARGKIGNAGVIASPFTAYIDNWKWEASTSAMYPSTIQFDVEGEVQVELSLSTDARFILHGERGYSVKLKNAAQASYYYSQPFIRLEGSVEIAGRRISVSGHGWFDHEWSSQYLDKNTSGWDWFSIHLENGGKLMLFNMRHNLHPEFWSGTYINSDGQQYSIREDRVKARIIKRTKVSGRSLPLNWEIELLDHDISLEISPFKDEQWNDGIFSYYEGAISVSGTHKGVGFIELTGY